MTYQSRADLGGSPDSRAVLPEAEGELFHAPWEPRVLALTLAMGATGLWNIDMSRSARETLENYSELSYYEIWLAGLQKLLQGSGATSADEISSGRMSRPAIQVVRVLSAQAGPGLATPERRPQARQPPLARLRRARPRWRADSSDRS